MKKSLGYQLQVDFYNCNPAIINNLSAIKNILEEGANKMNLSIVKTIIHEFSPIGISGVVVIEESHIAIHTWPEHNYVALDFFTCNKSYPLDNGITWIQQQFEASNVEKKEGQRGLMDKITSEKCL